MASRSSCTSIIKASAALGALLLLAVLLIDIAIELPGKTSAFYAASIMLTGMSAKLLLSFGGNGRWIAYSAVFAATVAANYVALMLLFVKSLETIGALSIVVAYIFLMQGAILGISLVVSFITR